MDIQRYKEYKNKLDNSIVRIKDITYKEDLEDTFGRKCIDRITTECGKKFSKKEFKRLYREE